MFISSILPFPNALSSSPSPHTIYWAEPASSHSNNSLCSSTQILLTASGASSLEQKFWLQCLKFSAKFWVVIISPQNIHILNEVCPDLAQITISKVQVPTVVESGVFVELRRVQVVAQAVALEQPWQVVGTLVTENF